MHRTKRTSQLVVLVIILQKVQNNGRRVYRTRDKESGESFLGEKTSNTTTINASTTKHVFKQGAQKQKKKEKIHSDEIRYEIVMH
jgi:hypothetical protein